MSNYPGRTKGTRRIVIWHKGKREEKIIIGTKTDGDEWEARRRLELSGQDTVDPKRIPAFSDFCVSRYKPHAERHLKGSTWNTVRVYQVDTLCKVIGHLKITDVPRPEAIERYKAERSKAKVFRHGAWHPMKPSSINNELRVLRTILNWARELGYSVPVFKWKKLPIRGKARARAWTGEQIQALYSAAKDRAPELVPMFVFLMNTGCRKGEAIVAEWSWVDLDEGYLRIPSNEAWQPKNGEPREVPIADALRAALGGPRRHPKYLFPTQLRSRYAYFPKDIFDDIRTAAGVTGGPHGFRHTFASHFLKNRPDLFLLGQVMGHSHQRVTELYSHMLPDHLALARNAVNIAPRLQTVAGTVAEDKGKVANRAKKTAK